ncbi:NACHT, LRR and PYD domains-containing protein 3-like isoform X2 [Megalobrama amblycephala]|nr:NACHT, LRR and PYD domains-containing protein 3-like isoform X2 [Megalobrama amblycephala]XP_048016475.1 NACHT, LRR and PYD domains-containing protein 3-like isoform X2 [Megalobrama amblycephala]
MSHVQKIKDGDFSPGCSSVPLDRSDSPEPSCVSMKSDWSMNHPPEFKDGETQMNLSSVQQKRSDSPEPSCVSMNSNWSMDHPPEMKGGDRKQNLSLVQHERSDSPEPSCVSMKSDWSMDHPPEMKGGDRRQSLRRPRPAVTEPFCKKMKYEECMNQPQDFNGSTYPGISHEVLNRFRSNLKKKFECLYEGTAQQGNPTLLNEIYTELYITESESGEISNEHEVRQIETLSRRAATEDTPMQCNDIFRPLPGQDKPIRTVLTKGVAGIGKTVSVQKFILDWAEGKENQDIQLIFPLPFREINLMKDKTLSLSDLLHAFFPETKEMEISSDKYKVLFIFDGLDECRLPLNFHRNETLRDQTKETSVDVLLTNLIAGNLLPSALIWITSRPAAADLVPSECVHRVTEVRGFNEPQKEEYFRKRISDQSLANTIISHLKSSRSLDIMCHIPVFCWISAAVLEKMLSEAESGEIPKTLTQMYTHFLILQINIKHEKDYEKNVTDADMILKLGKVAFQQLKKGNVIFYEEDLRECGIDVTEASVYSGLCTQIFREEFGWYQGKVFCFVHLSVQEHLAALYVHLSYTNNINVYDYEQKINICDLYQRVINDEFKLFSNCFESIDSLSELHQRAVNEALQSKNGHLDLFLRFLVGLSVESHQALLQGLKIQTRSLHNNQETVQYISHRIRKCCSSEKSINLFHCLNELGDHSLLEEIQHYLKSGKIKEIELSFSQWSALLFLLLNSEQKMDVFRLSRYTGPNMFPDEVLLTLLPVVEASRSAQLDDRNLTVISFNHLASVLSSKYSCLRDLNLSGNYLGDNGVELFCAELKNPHCKLEKLELMCCGVTDKGCAALASALISNPSHLRELNLEWNKLGKGVELLTDLRKNPYYKLETLRLNHMYVTAEGCAAVASALRSKSSHLNLCECNLGPSGMKLLSAVLENPHCKVKTLELRYCGVADEGCAVLASALRSNPSNLRELDLTWNHLGDSGVTLLSAGLEDPHCKLQKFKLEHCAITDEGCTVLASAFRSNPSNLRELDLTWNHLGDSGVTLLSAVLEDPHCKLQKLKLEHCAITDEGCAALASALRSNPSHLKELDLSWNELKVPVKLLCVALEDSDCKLEKLRLSYCGLTDEGCATLTSALRSNPSHLRELDLTGNKIGVQLLSDLKKDPRYKLGLQR